MLLHLENYDVAFSHDNVHDASGQLINPDQMTDQMKSGIKDVALLVVENSDLPKIQGHPQSVLLKDEQISKTLVVVFNQAGQNVEAIACINLPDDVYQTLLSFKTIWFCGLDDEKVVFEHELTVQK